MTRELINEILESVGLEETPRQKTDDFAHGDHPDESPLNEKHWFTADRQKPVRGREPAPLSSIKQ